MRQTKHGRDAAEDEHAATEYRARGKSQVIAQHEDQHSRRYEECE
jgi:hypothetical protein